MGILVALVIWTQVCGRSQQCGAPPGNGHSVSGYADLTRSSQNSIACVWSLLSSLIEMRFTIVWDTSPSSNVRSSL